MTDRPCIMFRSILIPSLALLIMGTAHAQTITPQVVGSGGGTAPIPGLGSVSWTVGEVAVDAASNLTEGFHQADVPRVGLFSKAFLEGPFVAGTPNRMNASLRTLPGFPLMEPYTALGYTQVGGGGETTTPAVLANNDLNNAIVDWVFLELRSATNPSLVRSTACGLIQRDGDIVSKDGATPVTFIAAPGSYYLVVKHRNHLGVMTQSPISFSFIGNMPLDLTVAGTPTFGTNARKTIGAARVLWAGDVIGNGQLKYAGSGNDRDPILVAIGGSVPTNSVTGYANTDVNMDGITRYAGSGNDRDPLLTNIGGTVPTATRQAQLP